MNPVSRGALLRQWRRSRCCPITPTLSSNKELRPCETRVCACPMQLLFGERAPRILRFVSVHNSPSGQVHLAQLALVAIVGIIRMIRIGMVVAVGARAVGTVCTEPRRARQAMSVFVFRQQSPRQRLVLSIVLP